jgi:hypothetical protein
MLNKVILFGKIGDRFDLREPKILIFLVIVAERAL